MFKRLTKGGGYVIIYSTIEDRSYGSGLKSKKSIESPIQSLKCPPPLNGIEQRRWGKEIR
jgi:hypothetical protein